MHPRSPSRLGVIGVAVLVSLPVLGTVAADAPANAAPLHTTGRSAVDRLVAVVADTARQAKALEATAAKVVNATTTATRKAVSAGLVIQNITTGGPTTTVAIKEPSAAAIGVAPVGAFAVGQLDQTFVDTTRPTQANGSNAPASSSRSMATTVMYPTGAASGAASGTASGIAFPVLVFAHGLGGTPKRYLDLLRPIASAGYVVVAPTFPLSNAATPGGATISDELQQPGDMRFVVDQVVALGAQSGNPLSGIVDGSRLAAAGHSLGGITTLDDAYGSGSDKRLRAAIPISSILNPLSGASAFSRPMVPLLLIHGDLDQTVPYSIGSVATFAAAPSPKALLTIRNGNHTFGLGRSSNPSPAVGAAVVSAMVDFLDRYLKDDPTGINRLQSLATGQPGLLRFDAAGL